MTTLLSIKQAIGEVLEQNGYKVFASEVNEGFSKPACFVELSDFASQVMNNYMATITATFDVLYVPQEQTHEHIIVVADELQRLFCNLSLEVGDRNFNIDSINGDIEEGNIRLSLEFSFADEPIEPQGKYKEYEVAQNLGLEV